MIVDLIKPDSGEITLNEHRDTKLPMHRRAMLGLGYLPQEPSIFRKLTVADNLRAVLELQSDLSDGQRELKIDELLEEFSIGHLRIQPALGL